ncbi:SARP family transcriptional regulator [Amycolatopsis sp. NBRC 101858]|uniref:AfsR/SARP family transcriptional regulator n=1 Tax=Amycolatopsis sp. NBRC 101858 TaxID=3032200 RepID=UPI0024A33A16|nr:tetratricopeptide repeat protein [Amycolatopsis sp. NBRC 101858]GLY42977.1 SARP family transcriptional regulator [Amycolatopsis sp. NBRC 101858]
MEISFGILGQTALLLHGNPGVKPVRGRPGKVLATLLAHPNQRVSVDTVVAWAWDERENLPQDALGTLHQVGARLRQILDSEGVDPRSISIAKTGCRLDVDEQQIDYRQFRSMMTHARGSHDRGQHDRAHVEALAALRLRRDEPLGELRTDAADDWRRRWERNEWVPANAFVAAQQLLLGQTEMAVSRLEELDAAHPMELSLAKLRIRALVAAGRGLEAAEYFRLVYREFRERGDLQAADELRAVYNEVIKPGAATFPALPKLSPPSPQVEKQTVDDRTLPPVWHLSPDIDGVVGRGGVIAELDAFTTDSAGLPRSEVLMLTGAPGVGKTTVALKWAHRAASRYPGGVVMLDLRGDGQTAGASAADVVELLLELMDVQVDQIVSSIARAARLTRLLQQRRILVILDNVARTDQVEPLLRVLAGCTVVVVTRQRLSALLAVRTCPVVTVGPLSEEASRELLERRIGLRVRQDSAGVTGLIRLCQGNALALTLVAVRAAARAGMRLTTLADALRDADMLLDLGNDGDGLGGSLRSAFTLSFQGLASAEQRTFAMLGLHPGIEVASDAVAAADGRPVSSVRRSLDVLVAAHLIEQPGDLDRYRMHNLLQLFAASLARKLTDGDVARRRLLEFYLVTAFEAHRMVYPGRGRLDMPQISAGVVAARFTTAAAARQWFLRERTTLTASVELAAQFQLHEVAFTLPSLTADVFDRHGYFGDIITGFKVAASSAAAVGDVDAEASSLNDLGHVLLLMGQDSRAEPYLEAALRLVDEHGIGIGRVTVMLNMARRHLHAGRVAQAVTMSRETLVAARALGEPERCAAALHRLADALLEQGGHETDALELYREALVLRERIDDGPGRILTHIAMGDLLTRMGRFEEAGEQCQRASVLVSASQYLPAAMKLNTVFARLRHAEGDDRVALKHAHRAVELADRSGHATGRGKALDTLAQILRDRGNVDDARALWERAAQLFRDRERVGQAQRIEALLEELDFAVIPQARDGDTVAMPSPRLSRS